MQTLSTVRMAVLSKSGPLVVHVLRGKLPRQYFYQRLGVSAALTCSHEGHLVAGVHLKSIVKVTL